MSLAVAVLPAAGQLSFNQTPTRVLGQPNLTSNTLNLVEGRELYNPLSVALDTRVNPPMLYVSDSANNRVLGWRNANSFANGATADIVIGQRDLLTTAPSGPRAGFSSGLLAPAGIAVDSNGHLFVVDVGNNRILRYKRPFDQPDSVKMASLVIGQPSLSGYAANAQFLTDSNRINPKNLSVNPGNSGTCSSGCFFSDIKFDPSGNLWFTDAANNRVLRYPASSIGDQQDLNTVVEANSQLGQTSYNSGDPAPSNFQGRTSKVQLLHPGGLGVDHPSGNVWVADDLSRVLVYRTPVDPGKAADRIAGIALQVQGQPTLQPINEIGVGLVQGIFFQGDIPFLVDTYYSRILRYDPLDQWPPENLATPGPNSYSPSAKAVIGQDNFNTGTANRTATAEPSASSFAFPSGVAVSQNAEVFIADSANNRVLVFPDLSKGPVTAPAGAPYQAVRLIGQDYYHMRMPNLIEGREINPLSITNSGVQTTFGMGMAVDTKSEPPRLYVADTGNNRILGFADARRVKPGDKADIVIGQVDFTRALYNSPNNDRSRPTDSGLNSPTHVAVDSSGNLWVTDFGNSRVLRFPAPFAQSGTQHADLVIGQDSFTTRITDATQRTMAGPFGLAFTGQGHLLVSDVVHNRVLFFLAPFTSGMAANKVFGQPDFTTTQLGSDLNRLNGPQGLAVDSDDRLYVADSGNNRISFFERPPSAADSNANAVFVLPVNGPTSVAVSLASGDIWVAEARGSRVSRFPLYNQLISNPNPNLQIPAASPLGVRLDAFDNVLITDLNSRIGLYFPSLSVTNAANYFVRVTPGMIATLFLQTKGPVVVDKGVVFNGAPWPSNLADMAVMVENTLAPLYYVYPQQLAFQVPSNAPTGGTANVTVFRVSTGQVYASSFVRMDVASPAFFTRNQQGNGLVAALNQDNSINDSSTAPSATPPLSPARPGEVVQFFLTGQGVISGMPPDGMPPSGQVTTTPGDLFFTINGQQAEVTFSGLAPCCIGLWQINAKVPANTPPLPNIPVALRYRGISSTQNPSTGQLIQTWIAVRPL